MKIKNLSALMFVTALLGSLSAFAEETTSEKIQNQADETGKDLKKTGRKVKKVIRDTTGNESTKEDLKDKAKDIGSEVSTKAKKIKRKVD